MKILSTLGCVPLCVLSALACAAPAPWNAEADWKEAQAEMGRVMEQLRGQNEILDTIRDRETANSGAMKLMDNFTRYFAAVSRLDVLVGRLDASEQRALERGVRSEFMLRKEAVHAKIQALQAADCYGSEALQAAFGLYFRHGN
ncbi:MAG: hypothetical protein LUG84_02400 [Akkermansiaceae bacterium]|nr:hypothetical protein [Akkermansiaceae bacterium]MCD8070033.1 hypothetical protein [Akkermansiaceae bacterium]